MSIREYLRESRDLSLNIALVVPALVVYEIGVAFLGPSVRNGAQVLLRELFLLVGPLGVHILNALLIATGVVCVIDAYRRHQNLLTRLALILLESLAYGAVLGPLVLLLESPLLDVGSGGGNGGISPVFTYVVLALGAGAYEELFFRLLLMGAVFHVVFGLMKESRWAASTVALVVAAVVFALCHHDIVLRGGEPFELQRFLFRTLAGLVLGLIFYLRGFAAAVYTHAFYNLLVFLR